MLERREIGELWISCFKMDLDCIRVMHRDAMMTSLGKSAKKRPKKSPRITISLPPESYEQVIRIARRKKVSASWVVRDAVEQYLTADIPLFAQDR